MSTANYPENVDASVGGAERPTWRDRSEWLYAVVGVSAAFGFGDLMRDDPVTTATLPGVIWKAIFLGAVAAFVGRDGRERWAGVLSGIPVVAVGVVAIRLLSAGWALTVIIAAMAAVCAAFTMWQQRRTPSVRQPRAVTVPLVPAEPLAAPVAGRCRWCGHRPVGVICGSRSDGGPCEQA